MTKVATAFVILFFLAAILFVWMLRLDAKPVTDTSFVITDHWTERVYLCSIKGGCLQIYPQDQK